MKELQLGIFDIYALALPRGHGFERRPPLKRGKVTTPFPMESSEKMSTPMR